VNSSSSSAEETGEVAPELVKQRRTIAADRCGCGYVVVGPGLGLEAELERV